MSDSIPLSVADADLAVAFYRDVFDATELDRECLMDGQILTAALVIGQHHLVVSEWDPAPADPDAAVLTLECAASAELLERALAAGARLEPGAGAAGVVLRDPAGQRWMIVDGA